MQSPIRCVVKKAQKVRKTALPSLQDSINDITKNGGLHPRLCSLQAFSFLSHHFNNISPIRKSLLFKKNSSYRYRYRYRCSIIRYRFR